jgi:hypothetical protein
MTSSGFFYVSSSFGVKASIKVELLRSSCPLVLDGIFDWSADMLQLSLCRFSGIFTLELRHLCLTPMFPVLRHTPPGIPVCTNLAHFSFNFEYPV